MTRLLLLAALACATLCTPAFAQPFLNFEGELTDMLGRPIEGTSTLTFTVHVGVADAPAVWT